MVPNIRELKKICQPKEITEKDPFYYSHIIRKFSIYATWLFLHTPLSANQITLIHLICGIIGGILIGFHSYALILLGAIFIQLHVFFDNVDGEVARYRKTTHSVIGPFTDRIGHNIVNSTLFIGMTFNVYRYYQGNLFVLLLGFLALTYYTVIFNYQAQWYLAIAESKDPDPDGAFTIKVLSYRDYKKLIFKEQEKFLFFKYILKISSYIFFFRFREVLPVMAVFKRMDFLLFAYGAVLPFMLIGMYCFDYFRIAKNNKIKI